MARVSVYSAGRAAIAASVGAKTVKGPLDARTSVRLADTTDDTREVRPCSVGEGKGEI